MKPKKAIIESQTEKFFATIVIEPKTAELDVENFEKLKKHLISYQNELKELEEEIKRLIGLFTWKFEENHQEKSFIIYETMSIVMNMINKNEDQTLSVNDIRIQKIFSNYDATFFEKFINDMNKILEKSIPKIRKITSQIVSLAQDKIKSFDCQKLLTDSLPNIKMPYIPSEYREEDIEKLLANCLISIENNMNELALYTINKKGQLQKVTDFSAVVFFDSYGYAILWEHYFNRNEFSYPIDNETVDYLGKAIFSSDNTTDKVFFLMLSESFFRIEDKDFIIENLKMIKESIKANAIRDCLQNMIDGITLLDDEEVDLFVLFMNYERFNMYDRKDHISEKITTSIPPCFLSTISLLNAPKSLLDELRVANITEDDITIESLTDYYYQTGILEERKSK